MAAVRARHIVVVAVALLAMAGCSGSRSPAPSAGAGGAATTAGLDASSRLHLAAAWDWSPPPGFSVGIPASDSSEIALTTEHQLTVLLDAKGAVRWRVERPVRDVAPALTADSVLVPTEKGLLALDRATGRERWTATLDDRTNTPVVVGGVGGRAVVTTWKGLLAGIDLADGSVAWRTPLGGASLGPAAVSGSTAVATFDTGHVAGAVAVDAATGRQRWAVALPPDGTSAPAIVAGPDGRGATVVVVAADVAAHGLALDNGAERWRTPIEGAGSPEVPPLPQADGTVVASHRQGGMALLDAADGRVRWEARSDSAAIRGGPAGPGPNGWFALPLFDGRLLLGGADRRADVREPPSLANGVAMGPGGLLLVATAQGKDNRLSAVKGW